MPGYPANLSLRLTYPDFLDLPWDMPLSQWQGNCVRLEQVLHGLSRHPVVFVNYDGNLFALKELPPRVAEQEYIHLLNIEKQRLPVVQAVGHAQTQTVNGSASVLITGYLDSSLPYRTLFMQSSLERYRQHLLDAIAGLLVQLHLAGIYWGDCSLSNTLFRRDAGALQAYLVDAETAEVYSGPVPPASRLQDLQIMEENINGELVDLEAANLLSEAMAPIPLLDTGAYIRLRYQNLWELITHEDMIGPGERYRIQERIRALNELGFSIGEVDLAGTADGDQLRLRVVVTDRNFHRDQLQGLTGLEAEEKQAQLMVNEIQGIKATLSQQNNRSMTLSAAAYHWLENIYTPTVGLLEPLIKDHASAAELYCQVLEHKWYLSERARHDVGHRLAAEDYLKTFGIEDQTR
ncbi:MAG: DUF4032 domain-containing protein [Anaerolineales bacterium]